LQQVVDGMTELYGQNHPAVLDAVDNLAFHFRLVGDHERALPLFVAEAAGRKIRQGPTDKSTIDALYYVADTMSKLERRVDEEQVWTELVSIKRVSQPPDVKLLAGYLARLGKCQLLLQKFPAAETNLRESLALYLTQQSQEARTAQVKSLLGEALVKLERYDEAESLLIDACTALAEHKSQLAEEDRESQLRRSVERIIELYQRWGRPDDVKKWSMKLRPADTNPGFQEKETGKILSAG
jgi:tetratricopeptide (TPR) repeat protein